MKEETKTRAKESLNQKKRNLFQRIAKVLFHRAALAGFFIALQLAVLVAGIVGLSQMFWVVNVLCILVSMVMVLWVLMGNAQPDYKMAWVILIIAFPVFGGLFYLFFGANRVGRRAKRKMAHQEEIKQSFMGTASARTRAELEHIGPEAVNQSRFLENFSGSPPHVHTVSQYFPLGEDLFRSMIEELRRAQHYIFLEYFIIQEGVMWDTILQILEEKAARGVDVRVLYDDIGSIYTLPKDYDRVLRSKGIACEVFNRFRPVVSLRLNNRDHRKICVIDGHVGYTGGINLADEYINVKERFGHWKDSAILLKGDAVWNFTVMFLSAWDQIVGIDEDFEQFRPRLYLQEAYPTDGVVQPYDDSPLDDKAVGAAVYHNLISKANDYIYFTTPYLVVDQDMTAALCMAAQSGVDVRIITPGIPDKRMVFEVTRAHYARLLEAGVRIFEYTPGFIHAKNFVVDGKYGTVGTINMDYRSLYLHFECGVWLAENSALLDVRDDFLRTQAESREITLDEAERFARPKSLLHALLRVFAPLM